MWEGTLESIHISPQAAAALKDVPEARVVPGKGIEGDRYFDGTGTWSNHPGNGREVTLVEAEAIAAIASESGINLAPGASRRNLVTRGVPLNHLVGREFRVGEVRLKGMRLCEPCEHLEGLTQKGVKSALLHRAGLRAEALSEGTLRIGDTIALVE
ncbi:MAG: MOSC domain-containing protein [Deltaproteobacteria bacterium]